MRRGWCWQIGGYRCGNVTRQAFDAARDKSKPRMFKAVIQKIDKFYKFCRSVEK